MHRTYRQREGLAVSVVDDVLITPVGRGSDESVELRKCEVEAGQAYPR